MKNENEYGARLTVLAHDMVDQLGTDAPEWATEVAAAAGHPGVWGDLDVDTYDRGQLAALVWDDRVPRELHGQALRRLVAHRRHDARGRRMSVAPHYLQRASAV